MNRSFEAGGLSAEEVVSAIAGAVTFSSPPRDADRQLSLARARLDTQLAELALEQILSRLEKCPRDSAALLALVLLGEAHPEAADAVRISPKEEAARLVDLLEGEGSLEWAAALRRVLEVEIHEPTVSLVARRGSGSGPACSRIARMAPRIRRPSRGFVALGLGLVLLAGGLWRELDLRAQWVAVPPAEAGDLHSVEQRVAKLGELIEENAPWLGLPAVAGERLRLEGELRRLARAEFVRMEGERREAEHRIADAEEARERALLALEAGSLREARQWFSYALERGGSEWDGARDVAHDLDRLGEEALAGRARTSAGGGITR